MLLANRHEFDTDISFFMNEVAERGFVVSVSTAGSGASMDNSSAVVTVAADASGAVPLGILLQDMVNVDQSRYTINKHKDEVNLGGKVAVLTKGFVTTDAISGTPSGGDTAYLADSGYISATQETGAVAIGRFLSSKNADGFAKVSVNLP
jgi:hypothetical protein